MANALEGLTVGGVDGLGDLLSQGGRKRGEKRQCVVASHVTATGNLDCNASMCHDWESNQ